MTDPAPLGHNAGPVGEFTTRAEIAALNAGLAERGLGAGAIIAVLLVPGTTLAGGAGDLYRVLYRIG